MKIFENKDEFEKLCALQCTPEELMQWFEYSDLNKFKKDVEKIYKNNFEKVYNKLKLQGIVAMRRMQIELAQTNSQLAIFLGKNYLGQTDKQESIVRIIDSKEARQELKEIFENKIK